MEIGLIDVDGHNFPNLALMKISRFHKNNGDMVQWEYQNYSKKYDIVYKSKVFSFTKDMSLSINSDRIMKGGTGYNFDKLPKEIDNLCPDYSIYPKFTEAYGFLTRGCPNKCNWCIVPDKEGNIQPYADIESFLDGRKNVVLMDNNVLASKHGLEQIEKIIRLGLKIDFNQGLDCRIIAKNENISELLGNVKWYKPLRMACDTLEQMTYIEKATNLLRKHNANPKQYFIYMLITDIEDAKKRLEFIHNLKLTPFAQPFISIDHKPTKTQKQFARFVNRKIYKVDDWENYKYSQYGTRTEIYSDLPGNVCTFDGRSKSIPQAKNRT
jgi:hypothetical protein